MTRWFPADRETAVGGSRQRALARKREVAQEWLAGATVAALARRWRVGTDAVIEAIDDALPAAVKAAEISRRRSRTARIGGLARSRMAQRRPIGHPDGGTFMAVEGAP